MVIVAIDQGTTSTRAIVFDASAQPIATAQRELAQHYPDSGWVEHDPEDIWRDTQAVVVEAIAAAGMSAVDIAAIGITNQRETTVIWDRLSGVPIHNAIVWQDRRTAAKCAELVAAGHGPAVTAATGLLIDSYFSATKIAWLLDHVPDARRRAEAGELAFGTIDSFLLWRLTGVHATDPTNASRTLLYDINAQAWSAALLDLFGIPAALLPEVRPSSGDFGMTDVFGALVPVTGMAGDQQAALVGQGCFAPGMAKATFGTGCFVLLHTGDAPVTSANRLIATTAYAIDGTTAYALEGSIFIAGAGVKWLRDGLGIIAHAADTVDMATEVTDNGGVYLVPGFVGLGAPHWAPEARGILSGLTLATTASHVARAALEAVAYQTHDLIEAMARDGGARLGVLRVDGGMAANDWLCQFLADILEVPVERPEMLETTARGAAFLAGLAVGTWCDLDEVAALATASDRFEPRGDPIMRQRLIAGWNDAVARALL